VTNLKTKYLTKQQTKPTPFLRS